MWYGFWSIFDRKRPQTETPENHRNPLPKDLLGRPGGTPGGPRDASGSPWGSHGQRRTCGILEVPVLGSHSKPGGDRSGPRTPPDFYLCSQELDPKEFSSLCGRIQLQKWISLGYSLPGGDSWGIPWGDLLVRPGGTPGGPPWGHLGVPMGIPWSAADMWHSSSDHLGEP